MKYNTAILLAATAPLAQAAQTCAKFTPTEPLLDIMNNRNAPTWDDQHQQMTAYKECKRGQPSWYYECKTSKLPAPKSNGCAYSGHGALSVHGTINATSALSAADRTHIFALVNANLSHKERSLHAMMDSMEGCISKWMPIERRCLPVGESGYVQARPKKYCVQGTLSGCSGPGGTLHEGMALEVCGGGMYSLFHTRSLLPNADWTWIHVDMEDQADYSFNPAFSGDNKEFCDILRGNAATGLAPSFAMGMAALGAAFFVTL